MILQLLYSLITEAKADKVRNIVRIGASSYPFNPLPQTIGNKWEGCDCGAWALNGATPNVSDPKTLKDTKAPKPVMA